MTEIQEKAFEELKKALFRYPEYYDIKEVHIEHKKDNKVIIEIELYFNKENAGE